MAKKKKVYRIYLFRHGETYYNEKGIFTGWKDSKLSPRGIRQAKIIAKKLKNKKIDVAFYTRLSRSKDTLKEVLKYHPECKLKIKDDRMIERNYGKLEGMNHKTFIKKIGDKAYNVLEHAHVIFDDLRSEDKKKIEELIGEAEYNIVHRSYKTKPTNGESIKMVEKRVKSFIKVLLKFIRKNKVNVAISAHGNSMRPFRRYFEKLSIKEMIKLENPWDDYFEYKVRA